MVELHPVAIPAQTQEMAGPGLQGLGISRHLTPAPVFLAFLCFINSLVFHICPLSSLVIPNAFTPHITYVRGSLPSLYTVKKWQKVTSENDIYLQIVITVINIKGYVA